MRMRVCDVYLDVCFVLHFGKNESFTVIWCVAAVLSAIAYVDARDCRTAFHIIHFETV